MMTTTPASTLPEPETPESLPEPVLPTALPGGDELADKLLEGETDKALPAGVTTISKANSETTEDEVAASNQVAETLASLQSLIERQANELNRLSEEMKQKRESLKNIFENDTQLGEAEAKAEVMTQEVKARRSQLQTDPQITSLKVQIGELNDQKKEIEESLSSHLVNYHQITNSTSFDTSDGDQWDFNVRAKLKARKSHAE